MTHKIALAVASAAAALTLAVALAAAGFAPRPAVSTAADAAPTTDATAADAAPAPTIQVDTIYLAPPPPQQTITVHKVEQSSRGRVRGRRNTSPAGTTEMSDIRSGGRPREQAAAAPSGEARAVPPRALPARPLCPPAASAPTAGRSAQAAARSRGRFGSPSR